MCDHLVSDAKIRAVKQRDGMCLWCGRRPPQVSLTIDHLIPQSKGGSHSISNLVAACPSCNYRRQNRSVSEWINKLVEWGVGEEKEIRARIRRARRRVVKFECGRRAA